MPRRAARLAARRRPAAHRARPARRTSRRFPLGTLDHVLGVGAAWSPDGRTHRVPARRRPLRQRRDGARERRGRDVRRHRRARTSPAPSGRPTAREIAFADGSALSSSQRRRLRHAHGLRRATARTVNPSWSPDGDTHRVRAQRGGALVDLARRRARAERARRSIERQRRTTASRSSRRCRDRLAFISDRQHVRAARRRTSTRSTSPSPTGGRPAKLVDDVHPIAPPRWSPTAAQIAVAAGQECRRWGIYVVSRASASSAHRRIEPLPLRRARRRQRRRSTARRTSTSSAASPATTRSTAATARTGSRATAATTGSAGAGTTPLRRPRQRRHRRRRRQRPDRRRPRQRHDRRRAGQRHGRGARTASATSSTAARPRHARRSTGSTSYATASTCSGRKLAPWRAAAIRPTTAGSSAASSRARDARALPRSTACAAARGRSSSSPATCTARASSTSAAASARSGSSCSPRAPERATNVELSGGYEDAAAELIAERGVASRVERRVGDIVDDGGASSRTTSSSCTASSAAIPTSTHSWARRPTCTQRAPRAHVSAGAPRGSAGACAAINVWLRLSRLRLPHLPPPGRAHRRRGGEHGLRLERRVQHGAALGVRLARALAQDARVPERVAARAAARRRARAGPRRPGSSRAAGRSPC